MEAPKAKVWKCQFSYPWTYGHECGKPAVLIAVHKGEGSTTDGMFYAGRCAECAKVKGLENSGVIRFEPIADQENKWK